MAQEDGPSVENTPSFRPSAGRPPPRLRPDEAPDQAQQPFDLRLFYRDQDPFSAHLDPSFLYTNAELRALYGSLLNSIRTNRGLFLLTGERGTGKTALLERLAQELRASDCLVISSYRAGLSFQDLASVLSSEFGVADAVSDDQRRLTCIQKAIGEHEEAQRHVVLFIDDAQNLGGNVITKLHPLTQTPDGSPGALRLVLGGRPGIRPRLDLPVLADLVGALVLHCELEPLSDDDIVSLMWHRLRRAGHRGIDMFSDGAVAAITRRARGVPGRAVFLSASALRLASARGQLIVTDELVEQAASELPDHGADFPAPPDEHRPLHTSRLQLAGAILVGLGVFSTAAGALVGGIPDVGRWAAIGQTISSSISAHLLPPKREGADVQAADRADRDALRRASLENETVPVPLAQLSLGMDAMAAVPRPLAVLSALPGPGTVDQEADDILWRIRSVSVEADGADRQAGSPDLRVLAEDDGSPVGAATPGRAPSPSFAGEPPAATQSEAVDPVAAPPIDQAIVSESGPPEAASATGTPDGETMEPTQGGSAATDAAPSTGQSKAADDARTEDGTDPAPSDTPTALSDMLEPSPSTTEPEAAVVAAPSGTAGPLPAPAADASSNDAAVNAGDVLRLSKQDPSDRADPQGRIGSSSAISRPAVVPAVVPEPAPLKESAPISKQMVGTLMRRGHEMLAVGDISAARLLYERAAAAGDAKAATAAGKTYDPAFLREIAARGVPPRPDRAAEWYRKAIEAGDAEAKARLNKLKAATGE